ncbi:hypothetical protein HIM_03297 [Hirsutella minnesotensis 3608]|nr:hypothetical protein HIM_03297 [Hirsutella minnesotensis 3608]
MPSIYSLAHMCSHLKNASRAKLGITSLKNSKYNLQLALAMHRSGFLSAVARSTDAPESLEQMVSTEPEKITTANVSQMRIWVGLKYWKGKPVLSQAHLISKPKRIIAADISQIARLTRGVSAPASGGVVKGLRMSECLFVSTSQGVLEAREALARQLGGVLLCRIFTAYSAKTGRHVLSRKTDEGVDFGAEVGKLCMMAVLRCVGCYVNWETRVAPLKVDPSTVVGLAHVLGLIEASSSEARRTGNLSNSSSNKSLIRLGRPGRAEMLSHDPMVPDVSSRIRASQHRPSSMSIC